MEGRVMERHRSDEVTLIAIYHFLMAGFLLLGLCALLGVIGMMAAANSWSDVAFPVLIMVAGALLTIALGAAHLVIGIGLLQLSNWTRWGAIILGVLAIPNFPLGTVIGGFSIWYLLTPDAKTLFGAEG